MYQYYNQFHMTDELAQTITSIVNQKEEANYVCKIISATIPEHTEEVYGYTGGVEGLSGADIAFRNEHYGRFYKTKIPTQEYEYIAVMESIAYQAFSKLSFRSDDEIKRALEALTVMFVKYDGIFDSNVFKERFPYLEDFFASIDEWRAETGRVTIDSDVLQQGYEKVLSRSSQSVRKQ